VFARPPGQPEEWQTMLKLAAIAQGKGASVDADALDDAQFADDAQRMFGAQAEAIVQATASLKGPQRALEVSLRTGPYGDGFGAKPDGLTLARVMASSEAGGIDLGALQPRIPEVLRTPSGMIELAHPSLLADMARAAADLARPAPDLVVIGRRDVRTNNSWMHNLPVLAKGPFRCTALVHPSDAARFGLTEGAMAQIASHSAQGPRSVQAPVHISAEMMPGVVSLPHGWGHNLAGTRLHVAAERPGANLNALLDDQLRDPLSGNAVLGGVAITMTPVPQTA
jgi:anaerobic selenocysteine-containing dehydrogenase